MKFLYRCLTYVYVLPLSIVVMITRLFGNRTQIERLGLGLSAIKSDCRPLWFVASSVGEVTIAVKLIKRLKEVAAQPVLLTVTTRTGRHNALQSGSHADVVAYHPLDIPKYVRRFLTIYNPTKIILLETELWPSLMTEALGRDIKIMQVSGRLSEKSLRRYAPFVPLFRPLLVRCDALLMQSEEDAVRLRELAGEDARIEVVGSLKGEYVPPAPVDLQKTSGYLRPWQNMQIVTCGSTRPGEEAILLYAFALLCKQLPDVHMVLAPRHLERTDEVLSLIKRSGLSYCQYSKSNLDEQTQVLLLDTIGQLNLFYHFSSVAFVGGTLVPLGGHNLLEPALAGCPVLYGPYCENQRAGYDLLVKYKMGIPVADAEDFSKSVVAIVNDQQAKSIYAARALALRQENASIIDRYIAAVTQ
jgi:3-deoxy-D-manno-octulosonic-acid transferase